MELLEYRFTLDSHKNGVQRVLQGFNTGDNRSRRLIISLTEAEESYDLPLDNIVAAMYVKRPSQTTPSINECTIDGNHIIYEVPSTDLVEEGVVNYQLKIINGTVENPISVLVAPRFSAEVWESITDDSEAEDSSEYTALEAALLKAQMVYDARIIKFIFDKDIPEYDSTSTYKIGDLVKNNLNIYICIEDIDEPEAWDSTKWEYKRDTSNPIYLTVVYGYDDDTQTHITYETDALIHIADEVYLSALADVDVSNIEDGQALIYNGTTEKWENTGVATAIDNLEDVDLTNISDGQILIYNGTTLKWENGGVVTSLSELSDIDLTSLSDGQILIYNATAQKWENGGVVTSLSELSDIDLTSVSDGQKLSYDATEQKWVNTDAVGSLEDLDNVQLTSLQNAQVIRYDSTAQKWVNAQGGYCDVVKISQSDYNNLSYDQIHDLTKIYAVYDAAGDTIDLGDLDDVDVTGATNGQFLKYDSAQGKWIPETSSATVASLSAIDDVSISQIQDGDTLQYDSTNSVWVNQPLNLDVDWGDIGGTLSDQTDLNTALSAKANAADVPDSLNDLSDINLSSIADGDTIVYDSTSQKFVNEPLPTSATWGNITGTLSNQTDLNTALGNKMDTSNPTATGSFSLNRKSNTTIGTKSFAEGNATTASGSASHAEGYATTASGDSSHAEGSSATASGYVSHAEGLHTVASSAYQHVEGQYNIADANNKYAHIIGNGENNALSNAFTVDWDGNVWCAGDVTQAKRTYTISAASWTTNSDSTTNTDYPYIYTVSVTGMTASDVPICQLFGASTVTTQDEMADIALVQEIVSGSGTLTLYATDAPTNNLTLQTIGK